MSELDTNLARQIETDDEAIWHGLVQKIPEAARELCNQFGPKLLAFAAARFSDDRQTAEDVMVQSLAKAASNIKLFNPKKSSFAAWIYGIARREIQNELRRRRRRRSVPTSAQIPMEDASELSDGQDMAGLITERVQAQRSVNELVRVLSELELDVLVLSSIDQLSVREIGRVVGRSERAVHSLLHRAKTKARERLDRDE